MAASRMFNISFMKSDIMLGLPPEARDLYVYLNLSADDDGIVESPKSTMKLTEASSEVLASLIQRGLIIQFDSGLVAIKHWNRNNHINKSHYRPTIFTEEQSALLLQKDGSYTLKENSDNATSPSLQQNAANPQQNAAQYSVDKNIAEKDNEDKNKREKESVCQEEEKGTRERERDNHVADCNTNNSTTPRKISDGFIQCGNYAFYEENMDNLEEKYGHSKLLSTIDRLINDGSFENVGHEERLRILEQALKNE